VADESLITDDMRAVIGVESEPWTVEVDRTSVRMFARAVGYADPVFYDEDEAKRRGYRSLPAPPAFLGTQVFTPADDTNPVVGPRLFETTLSRILNGGTEVEYFDTVCAGDVLTARARLTEVNERMGSIGSMLITNVATEYRNADGRLVAVMRGTVIYY
jgi:acyl dehydratase